MEGLGRLSAGGCTEVCYSENPLCTHLGIMVRRSCELWWWVHPFSWPLPCHQVLPFKQPGHTCSHAHLSCLCCADKYKIESVLKGWARLEVKLNFLCWTWLSHSWPERTFLLRQAHDNSVLLSFFLNVNLARPAVFLCLPVITLDQWSPSVWLRGNKIIQQSAFSTLTNLLK